MSRYDRDRFDDRRDRFDDRGPPRDSYGGGRGGPPRDYDRRDDRHNDRRDDRHDRYDRGGRNDRYDRRDDRDRGGRYGGRDDRRGGGRDRDWGRVPDRENTRLHVANLSKNARYDDLKRLFEKHGRVLNIDIKEGYGFIEFDSPRAAGDAKNDLDNFRYEGEEMKISWAKGKKPAFSAKGRGDFRIRIENLDKRTSWQDLKDFARHSGDVVFSDVWFENSQKFGAVEFRTQEEADNALRKLDGTTLDGSKVRLFLESKDSRGSERKTNSRSPPRDRSPAGGRGRSPAQRSPPRSPNDQSPAGRRAPSRSRSRSPPARSRTPE